MLETFGENVYQEFLDDLVPYTSATVWDLNTDYVLNDVVIHDGIYYKLNVADSTLSDTPNCNTEWTIAPKFYKECFNEMFSLSGGGLLKLLSWVVWANAAPFYPNVLGLTDFQGDDKAYKEKINYYLGKNIYPNIALMERKMWRWNSINKCVAVYVCEPKSSKQNQTQLGIAWD